MTIPLAWPIARFYHEPRMTALFPALGFGCVISGFASLRLLSLARHLGVDKTSFLELLGQLVNFVVALRLYREYARFRGLAIEIRASAFINHKRRAQPLGVCCEANSSRAGELASVTPFMCECDFLTTRQPGNALLIEPIKANPGCRDIVQIALISSCHEELLATSDTQFVLSRGQRLNLLYAGSVHQDRAMNPHESVWPELLGNQ